MSIAFECLSFIDVLAKATAAVLSTLMGVGGCGWPISSRATLIGQALRAVRKTPPTYASIAELMTFPRVWHKTWIIPFGAAVASGGVPGGSGWAPR